MSDEQRGELKTKLRAVPPSVKSPFAKAGSPPAVYAVASGKGASASRR